MMRKRPILFTLGFWALVGLAQTYLMFSCGFGAGHDEASSIAISECRYDAFKWMEWLNIAAIAVYSLLAIHAIRSLKN